MNAISYLPASILLFWSCVGFSHSPDHATKGFISSSESNAEQVYFTKTDAEKILGEKAFLSDSSTKTKGDTLEWKAAYSSVSKDDKTGRSGVIYFMLEKYEQESAARNAYREIKVANESHEGVKTVSGMGDEAYFHSDGSNFLFMLVRKGKAMFRMKVNKITSHTSAEEFNLVSQKIADNL